AHATDKMVAGDTTYVKGSTDNERMIWFKKSGTPSSPIQLFNAPGETPTTHFTDNGTSAILIAAGSGMGSRLPIGWITVVGFENEAPRSKLRGITELKHSELPEIVVRLPLPLHIPFDGLPVCPFPYRGHIIPVGPKLPAPQDPLHRRLSAKDLSRRDALEYLHNPARSHFRMRTAEQMDVILVRPNRFHFDRKPFRNLSSRLLANPRHYP